MEIKFDVEYNWLRVEQRTRLRNSIKNSKDRIEGRNRAMYLRNIFELEQVELEDKQDVKMDKLQATHSLSMGRLKEEQRSTSLVLLQQKDVSSPLLRRVTALH